MVDQIVCLDNGYLSIITTTVHVLPLDKIVVSKFGVGVKRLLHRPSRCWELWTTARAIISYILKPKKQIHYILCQSQYLSSFNEYMEI